MIFFIHFFRFALFFRSKRLPSLSLAAARICSGVRFDNRPKATVPASRFVAFINHVEHLLFTYFDMFIKRVAKEKFIASISADTFPSLSLPLSLSLSPLRRATAAYLACPFLKRKCVHFAFIHSFRSRPQSA